MPRSQTRVESSSPWPSTSTVTLSTQHEHPPRRTKSSLHRAPLKLEEPTVESNELNTHNKRRRVSKSPILFGPGAHRTTRASLTTNVHGQGTCNDSKRAIDSPAFAACPLLLIHQPITLIPFKSTCTLPLAKSRFACAEMNPLASADVDEAQQGDNGEERRLKRAYQR